MAPMLTRISVDGDIQPPERAAIRVLDHGFLFGDSVYEVLWSHRGVLIQEREHLERLESSARLVSMDLQHDRDDLLQAVRATIAAAREGPDEDAYVRLVVTRGYGPPNIDPSLSKRRSVVVVVTAADRPGREAFERGISVALVARRRMPAAALDPRAKTGNYLNNVLALHEAKTAGADDALLRNLSGDVAEASTSNVYVVRRGALATPPVSAGILEGTTRRRVLELSRGLGVPHAEARLLPEDVASADEVLLSSSVRGILPVTRIDGRPVGDGRPGPVTRRLHAAFERAADEEAEKALAAARA
jgi:branched-chain amino acid aminotransferase